MNVQIRYDDHTRSHENADALLAITREVIDKNVTGRVISVGDFSIEDAIAMISTLLAGILTEDGNRLGAAGLAYVFHTLIRSTIEKID